MDGVIRCIHRLRKYREREARLELVRAEDEARTQEARLHATNASIERSRATAGSTSAAEMARHHTFALRMEMVRRREETCLLERQVEVSDRRQEVRRAATDARIVELIADSREAAEAEALQTASNHQLDELGLQRWWRRTA